ncbi:MAG: nicotinate phosphoribosyltransferase [Verrucomicrobiota bacterium]
MNEEAKNLMEGFLFTDQYQLTMAQLYHKLGYHEEIVQFEYFFRDYPDYGNHQAGYCINAGLEWLVQWMLKTCITRKDIATLKGHTDDAGRRIFSDEFLDWLYENGSFERINMRAVPEGRVIHPQEPIVSVQGPLALCQILETALLNHLNYPILVATKAARIKASAMDRPVLEFGARRAQGLAGNAGTRAALIGGADFTSNVGVSHSLGYSPKGTHAHSMVQFFIALGMSELDAFRAYAEQYPDNCILLVDTINSLNSGIPNAIKVFEELRRKGHEPRGIRLDSGDLAYLSIQAHKMLNDAGFEDVSIVLSNELDELVIWQIIEEIRREAPKEGLDADALIGRLMYGVGTHLITSAGAPALSAAYKLTAVYKDQSWQPTIKVSDSMEKTPNPGFKNVWRVYNGRGKASADLLTSGDEDPAAEECLTLYHPSHGDKYRSLTRNDISDVQLLQVDILNDGELVYDFPDLETLRHHREVDLEQLDEGVKRIINPHIYHVSLSERLWNLKRKLIKWQTNS